MRSEWGGKGGGMGLGLLRSPRMRIQLITRYFDERNAGIGRVSSEILKGLLERNYEVHTVSTGGSSLPSYFRYTAFGVPWSLKRGLDIYHALTPMEGIWIPKNKGVVTFHDLFLFSNPNKTGSGLGYSKLKTLVGRRYFELASLVASRAKLLVCNSERTQQDVIRYLKVKEDKVRIVRLGIPSSLDFKGIKGSDKLRLGYLGQLDRRKRVDLLIKKFKASSLDAELVIGGIGVDETELRHIARGDDRIKFLGFIPEEGLCDFYNSLNLLIMPTWMEGYGLPIVEAMACKKPVMILSDAILPLEIRHRCIIVEDFKWAFSNDSYLLGLIRYADIGNNYQFAQEHSWDKCVDGYIEIYKEVLGEGD